MTNISYDLPSRPLPMINPKVVGSDNLTSNPPNIDARGLFKKKKDKEKKQIKFFEALFGPPENG